MALTAQKFDIAIPPNLTLHQAVSAIYLAYQERNDVDPYGALSPRYTIHWTGSIATPHLSIHDRNTRNKALDNLAFTIHASETGLRLTIPRSPIVLFSCLVVLPGFAAMLGYLGYLEGFTTDIQRGLVALVLILIGIMSTTSLSKRYKSDIDNILRRASEQPEQVNQ